MGTMLLMGAGKGSALLAETSDWVARVVTNGGATPSAATITAVNQFYADIFAIGGMWGGLAAPTSGQLVGGVNLLVPDSLIAAMTPQIVGLSDDPWTNNNFVLADLTVNGLVGDGATTYLNTGVTSDDLFSDGSQGSLAVYCYDGNDGETADIDSAEGGGDSWGMYVSFGGDAYFDCFDTVNGRVGPLANSAWQGFQLGSRTALNSSNIYIANSGTAWASLGSVATSDGVPFAQNVYVFCQNGSGTPTAFSSRRLSFVSLGFGLTSLQGQGLFNAVQAARTALGGGYR